MPYLGQILGRDHEQSGIMAETPATGMREHRARRSRRTSLAAGRPTEPVPVERSRSSLKRRTRSLESLKRILSVGLIRRSLRAISRAPLFQDREPICPYREPTRSRD